MHSDNTYQPYMQLQKFKQQVPFLKIKDGSLRNYKIMKTSNRNAKICQHQKDMISEMCMIPREYHPSAEDRASRVRDRVHHASEQRRNWSTPRQHSVRQCSSNKTTRTSMTRHLLTEMSSTNKQTFQCGWVSNTPEWHRWLYSTDCSTPRQKLSKSTLRYYENGLTMLTLPSNCRFPNSGVETTTYIKKTWCQTMVTWQWSRRPFSKGGRKWSSRSSYQWFSSNTNH